MLKVYACGGTGGNIGKQIDDLDVDVCYIDTSVSNLKNVDMDQVYLLDGYDGAGKHRATAYEGFKDAAEDVLIKFKPSKELNVVISSLSGGSGSVLSPMLVKELIKSGHNTVVIGIDSKNSVIELDNSIKTLKTFKSISSSVKKSITLFYVENNVRKEADARAIRFINLLSLLVNKEHTSEFDVSDLSNFINFDKVTDNSPNVTVIDINPNETIFPEKGTTVVSTILVTTDCNRTIQEVIPEYLSTCVVTDPNYQCEDIRIDNSLGKLSVIVDNLEKLITVFKDNKRVNRHKDLEVVGSNEDDIVL